MRYSQTFTPRMWWDSTRNMYGLATPYKEEFIMWLKLVSRTNKTWDAASKTWYFAEPIAEEVRRKVEKLYGSCTFTPKGAQAAPVVAVAGSVFKDFCDLVGEEILAKAFRLAAAKYHPDTGGDAAKMSALNSAWDAVKKGLSK